MSNTLGQCDWQMSRKKLCERGKYLLETGMWSDCKFLVGAELAQQTFDGHKLFLAMSSPVFEAMFFGGIPESNPITILDVQPEAFKSLLEYIYTDNINFTSFDQACELCYVAKKYMLPHLVEECTKYLWSDLYPRNACRAYEFAKLFEEPVLMEKCIQIITTQTEQVLSESNFEDIELTTLGTIFDQDVLLIDSELELYNALIRFAERQNQSTGAKMPRLDDIANASTENCSRSTTIRNILMKIRFLTMTPQQFAEGPATSDLLTQSEKFAILINISSPSTDIPMPAGFTTCRVPRIKRVFAIDDTAEPNKNVCVDTGRKYYCIRTVQEILPYRTTIGFNCEVSFTTDKNIIVCGIEIPSQMSHQNNKDQVLYNEVIYAYLTDGDGSRLTYTHCTSRVPFDTLIDISFNRPVYIFKNRVYKITVNLSKSGLYPLGLFPASSTCNGVSFSFSRDCVLENPEDMEKGVVRTIVFQVARDGMVVR